MVERHPMWRGRVAALFRGGLRRIAALPRGARLALVAVALVVGFVGVVLPLFASGGAPLAEITGQIPPTVAAGHQVRADLAIDNTGLSIVYPVCIAMAGPGAHLVSANFQGLDEVQATANRVCGGQLTGQQTISVTIVFSIDRPGPTTVRLTPEAGTTVIGAPLTATVAAS